MEYIAGTPLRSKLQSAPFADSTLLTYALQLAAALEHAHSRQIVHRDIKPENIIITGNDTLKVIDFGVALAMRDQLRSSADVNSRKFVGTLAYAAPELLSGGEASARSDIYSAGLVMYEMAYGQHPYSGLSGTALVEAVLTGTRSVAKSRSTSVSEGIDALIEQCLLRQPALRFSDGAALAAALRSIAADAARYWANLWARYP
jgi:serine/threonine-protein kinase